MEPTSWKCHKCGCVMEKKESVSIQGVLCEKLPDKCAQCGTEWELSEALDECDRLRDAIKGWRRGFEVTIGDLRAARLAITKKG